MSKKYSLPSEEQAED